MDRLQSIINSVCKPLIVYDIFVVALIMFNITQSDFSSAMKNSIFLLVGSVLIWALCFLGFGPVVWVLLSMPVFFVIAMLALLVITQIIKTDVQYDENGNRILITGKKLMDWFGIKDQDQIDRESGLEKDGSDDVNGQFTPFVDPSCKKPVIPEPPKISSKERVSGSLMAMIPSIPTCNVCDSCDKPPTCAAPTCAPSSCDTC
jgi:hypothetical protein